MGDKYFVYVLKSEKDNKMYTGYTASLEVRISEHNKGIVKSTKNRRPLTLLYWEEYGNKKEAMQREEFLKSGQGRLFLKQKL